MNSHEQNPESQNAEQTAPSPEWAIKGLTPPQLQRIESSTLNRGATPPALQQISSPPPHSSESSTASQAPSSPQQNNDPSDG